MAPMEPDALTVCCKDLGTALTSPACRRATLTGLPPRSLRSCEQRLTGSCVFVACRAAVEKSYADIFAVHSFQLASPIDEPDRREQQEELRLAEVGHRSFDHESRIRVRDIMQLTRALPGTIDGHDADGKRAFKHHPLIPQRFQFIHA